MDPISSIGEFIRQQRESAEVSLRELSRLAGVSNPYLSQIERGLRKPSAEILQQIAKGLSVSAETLYVHAGLLEEDSSRRLVIEAINLDPELNADQRQSLIGTYLEYIGARAPEKEESNV